MSNTRRARDGYRGNALLTALVLTLGLSMSSTDASAQTGQAGTGGTSSAAGQALSASQRAIAPISAFTTIGDMPRLNAALNQGLDAGLSISDIKEILVQLYAYAGFPRSLNALSALMQVVEDRRKRGILDAVGREPGPVPTGKDLLAVGTANQTKLLGAPVKGALFDFAPAIDEYLKTHLFGDIFARDNLDWQSRELATVAALASLPGAESQLHAHVRISTNVGITIPQLRAFAQVLSERVEASSGARLGDAIEQLVAASVRES